MVAYGPHKADVSGSNPLPAISGIRNSYGITKFFQCLVVPVIDRELEKMEGGAATSSRRGMEETSKQTSVEDLHKVGYFHFGFFSGKHTSERVDNYLEKAVAFIWVFSQAVEGNRLLTCLERHQRFKSSSTRYEVY